MYHNKKDTFFWGCYGPFSVLLYFELSDLRSSVGACRFSAIQFAQSGTPLDLLATINTVALKSTCQLRISRCNAA